MDEVTAQALASLIQALAEQTAAIRALAESNEAMIDLLAGKFDQQDADGFAVRYLDGSQ